MVPYPHSGTASPSTATPGAPHQNTQQQQPPPRSTSSVGPESAAAQQQHKRVYQACIPCRRRKVRCDLGSVDNPHDPPCVRCRRESKECFFSATRRKRKADDGDVSDHDEYIIRNGRKRLNNSGPSASRTPPPLDIEDRSRLYSDVPLTPGGSQGRSQPLRRPDDHNNGSVQGQTDGGRSRRRTQGEDDHHDHADANQQLENVEAQTVMRRGLYGPHDALDLLYKAATDRSVASEFSKARANAQASNTTPPQQGQQHQQPQQYNSQQQGFQRPQHRRHESRSSTVAAGINGGSGLSKSLGRSSSFGGSVVSDARDQRPKGDLQRHVSDHGVALPQVQQPSGRDDQQPIDPELSQQDLSSQPGYVEALRAWTRFRFVRAGWFTPLEAIEYIDYYYKYLSPMTPISPPTFSNPVSHVTLLTEEPILTVTLLTIASRYKQLDGPGGHCRSYAIHEQLWTYLRGMIERCLWGQEAFGSGFCGSGSSTMIEEATQTSSTAPWRGMRKGSLRTLGTIESLLILTEWHPRALHFPPQDATDELMLPEFEPPPPPASEPGEDGAPRNNNGASFGGKRIESWLEPAWRSDRMCWMLLSTGMGLAYELGVFDNIEEMIREEGANRPEFQDDAYRARAHRIKRLLLIYTTQLAGRLGWTSMCPDEVRRNDPAFSRHGAGNKQQRQQHGQAHAAGNSGNADEATPGTTFSSLSNHFNYIPDMELDDQIIHCWAGISHAMHMGNDKLFRSRRHTQEIIQSGKYVSLLGDFGPMLKDWAREFELFRLPPFIRCILKIEYEYVRIYVNSLSLQAVVERCTTNATGATALHGADGEQQHQQETQRQQQEQQQQQQQAQQQPQEQTGGGPPQLSPQTILNYGKLPLGQLGGFTVNDQEYVREVVEGSRNLLNEVVTGLLPHGYLKHAPVRTYFRIISGAMFLLKTFALGAPRSDVKASIDLMDATVEALRNCVVDDVHLGIRFADLLESLTSRLRNRFIQAPTMQQAATSGRGQSPLAGAETNGGNVQGDWIGGHAQSLRDGLNGQFRPLSPTMEANNISATPFDLTSAAFPYPGGASLGPSTPAAALDLTNNGAANANGQPPSNNQNQAPANSGIDATLFDEWNNPGNEMWYLPPGPAFFQNVGVGGDSSAVAMTSEGVNVGGLDLLDYMGMDSSQYGGANMEF